METKGKSVRGLIFGCRARDEIKKMRMGTFGNEVE